MRMMRFAVLITSLAIVSACEDPLGEDAILAPTPALAYTRFVNGVSDTGSTDWRFIDQLEYSPVEMGMRFRDFSPYAGTAVGQRTLKIFPTSTDINITQQHFIEQQITLEAGKYYTILHSGLTRTGSTPADAVIVFEDAIPATIGANNFATRFIHAGTGMVGQDVYALASTTTAIAGAPLFDNIAYGAQSTYDANRPACLNLAGPPATTPCSMAYRVTNDGSVVANASTLAPPGDTAQVVNNLTKIGGFQIAQSAMTGILFPASVTGSQARSFTAPGVVFIIDRHPK